MRKSKLEKCLIATKVDLWKTYDNVTCDYLQLTLEQFGFPAAIIFLIMRCVRSWWTLHLELVLCICASSFDLTIQDLVQQGSWKPINLAWGGHFLFTIIWSYLLLKRRVMSFWLRFVELSELQRLLGIWVFAKLCDSDSLEVVTMLSVNQSTNLHLYACHCHISFTPY